MADISLASGVTISLQTSSFQLCVNYKNFSSSCEAIVDTSEYDIVFLSADASFFSQASIVCQTSSFDLIFVGEQPQFQSVCNSVCDATCILTIGTLTEFSSNAPPIESYFNNPDFQPKADIKEFASVVNINSLTSITLSAGKNKTYASVANILSSITVDGLLGRTEYFASNAIAQLLISDNLYLNSGKQKFFDSTSEIVNNISCNLTSHVFNFDSTCDTTSSFVNVETYKKERFLPGPASITSNISANAIVGKIESFDSTATIYHYFIAYCDILGKEKSFASHANIICDSTCDVSFIGNNQPFPFAFGFGNSQIDLSLSIGRKEELASQCTILSNTNNVPSVFIYDNSSYYSQANIISKTSDDVTFISGKQENLASVANIVSSISLRETIGRIESFDSTCFISSQISDVNLIVGTQTGLSSKADIISQTNLVDVFYTGTIKEFESLATPYSYITCDVKIGKFENFASVCKIDSTTSADILVGIETHLESISNIQSKFDLSFIDYIGSNVSFDSTCTITNIVNANITVGELTQLSSNCGINSHCDNFDINIGRIEDLSSVCSISHSFKNVNLTIGKVEELSSHVNAYTQTIGDCIIGRVETLQSNVIAKSNTALYLTIGHNEQFESVCSINSNTSQPYAFIGRVEQLSSTANILSQTCDLDLSFGIVTEFSSNAKIQSYMFSAGFSPHVEQLSSNAKIYSDINLVLSLGKTESFASNVSIKSLTNAIQTYIGHYENFESLANIQSVTSSLYLNSITRLDSISQIQSKIDIDLHVGKIEELTSDCQIQSEFNIDTHLSQALFSDCIIKSKIDVDLHCGKLEEFRSNANIISQIQDFESIIGRVEELECNLANIKSKFSNIDIIFGKIKSFDSTSNIELITQIHECVNIDSHDPSSKILILELQYWMERILTKSIINREYIRRTSISTNVKLKENSILHLMFNDNYSQSDYCYTLTERQDKFSWPSYVKYKLSVYPLDSKYYVFDDMGSGNLFKIKSDDILMFDVLLQYRLKQNNIVLPDYNSLSTNLSKMIFIYLDMKLNKNIDKFDHIEFMSGKNSMVETTYECYLMNEIFTFVSGPNEQNN